LGRGHRRRRCGVTTSTLLSSYAIATSVRQVDGAGAVKMLTKGMCADWARFGLQVNGLGPGYFETELTRTLVDDQDFTAWLCKRTPAGRWGRVEELGGAMVFLASPASDFVNGQVIYVDGGLTSVV